MIDPAEKLLEEAMALEPGARRSYLERASEQDAGLRDELMSRLQRAEQADVFFDRLREVVFSSAFLGDDPELLPDDPHESVLAEGDILGRYRITSLVGKGGMGTLYRALDERLDRDVALKFLPSYLSTQPAARERLLMEARAVASFTHPNVCTIHEIAETPDGQMFFAMPFYDGITLKERLRQGRLSIDECLTTAIQIARGLAAAHAHGIIHRDVKPGNVMLSQDGTVRLLDFGLAIPVDGRLASAEGAHGTVAYMSPQQARGEPIDARSDLWSLGVVLHEMITGTRPFRGGSPPAVLNQIFHRNPEPVSIPRPEVPAELSRVVERLLERDPVKRFDSATELLEQLQRIVTHSSADSPVTRSIGRRALVFGSGVLFVVIGVLAWRRQSETKPNPPDHSSTRNIVAYEHYLRSMDQALVRTDSGARIALHHVRQAIAFDAGYAAAHARLARVQLRIANGHDPEMSRRDRLALAEQAALKAVALDDSSGESHAALGKVMKYLNRRPLAAAEFRRAIALEPSNSEFRQGLAELLLETGHPAEALAEATRARELTPLDPTAISEVATALLANGRCDEALAELAELRSLSPPLNRAAVVGAQCYARKKMWPQAIAELERITPTGGDRARAIMGYMLARAGRKAEARQILEDLIRRSREINGNAYYVAMIYAGMSEQDLALEWVARSVDDLSFIADWMPDITTAFNEDERFRPIARRLGIVVATR